MSATQSMTAPQGQTGDEKGRNPLIEMRMSIQFGTLPELRTIYVGLLWGRLRERYAQGVEQTPVPTQFETFGGPPQSGLPEFNIQFAEPIPRIVFGSAEGGFLLHIQQDRIMLQWRHYPSESTYPGYEAMRARFAAEIAEVTQFLADEQIGEIRPNQCELTYTNALLLPGVTDVHQHLDRITPHWQSIDVGLPFEAGIIKGQYVISSGDEPTGRLHTIFSPMVLTVTGEPNYQLEITARTRPADDTVAAAFATLDASHDLIGRAFKGVTSSSVRAPGGE